MPRGTTDPTAVVPAHVGVRGTTNPIAVFPAVVPVVYDDAATGTIIASGSGVESHVVTPVTPPRPPRPGPQQPARRRRRQRLTYRAAGRFTVVESIEVRVRGRYYADRERRFAGRYEVVASTRQTINASYVVSNLHALLLQEEDELLLLEEY